MVPTPQSWGRLKLAPNIQLLSGQISPQRFGCYFSQDYSVKTVLLNKNLQPCIKVLWCRQLVFMSFMCCACNFYFTMLIAILFSGKPICAMRCQACHSSACLSQSFMAAADTKVSQLLQVIKLSYVLGWTFSLLNNLLIIISLSLKCAMMPNILQIGKLQVFYYMICIS